MTTTPARPRTAAPRSWPARVGGGLLVLGTVQFFVMHLIVESSWTSPRYNWWTNYISDLGAVHCAPVLGNDVCSPLHAEMNTAFALQGLFLIAGIILSANVWSTRGNRRIWQVMVAITGISWIVVGSIPEDVNLTGHSLGALPIFILGNIALLVAGASKSTQNRPAVHHTALAFGIIGLLGFALTVIAVANPHGAIGIGGAERITVFPLQVWALICGSIILVRPYPSQRELVE